MQVIGHFFYVRMRCQVRCETTNMPPLFRRPKRVFPYPANSIVHTLSRKSNSGHSVRWRRRGERRASVSVESASLILVRKRVSPPRLPLENNLAGHQNGLETEDGPIVFSPPTCPIGYQFLLRAVTNRRPVSSAPRNYRPRGILAHRRNVARVQTPRVNK